MVWTFLCSKIVLLRSKYQKTTVNVRVQVKSYYLFFSQITFWRYKPI